MLFYFSLGILILTLGAQLVLRFFVHQRGLARTEGGLTRTEHRSMRTEGGLTRMPSILEADRRGFFEGRSGLTRKIVEADIIKLCSQIAFRFSLVAIFSLLSYQTYQQYQLWLKNDISKYLLPPYQSISYFIFYSFARFFAPYLISLAAAFLFLFLAKILNKKYGEHFFYPEEPYFGALSLFLVSHPSWIFYLTLLIVIYLVIHLVALTRNNADSAEGAEQRGKIRISLRYLWIPIAIFVIIFNELFLSDLFWWQLLKI